MSSQYLSDDELAELAKKMRVADPNQKNGVFDSINRTEALVWLTTMGVQSLSPASFISEDEARKRLRHALWDSQRIDYLFPGTKFSQSNRLDIAKFPSWPRWEEPHKELRNRTIGLQQLDGFKDAKKLDSYVFRHFQMSAFTQMQNMAGASLNPAKDITGGWNGVKGMMSSAALDLTDLGGKALPFVTFFTKNHDILLIEILDVKECPWPEPSKSQMSLIRTCQETKFGHPANGPLVPMMQTPKFPLLIVRYSYMEGRPEGGSQFTLHLEKRVKETMPGASARAVREKLQWHMATGIEKPEAHLRMFARLLSANADLVDPDYVREMQSHWNKISEAVIKETRISFFVPCLRLRWRALEEIETGIAPKVIKTCHACSKPVEKMMCSSCKSVYYCNAKCSTSDWSQHKADCKFSRRFLEGKDKDLPSNKFYVPTRTYADFVLENGFAVEQEAVRMSGLAPVLECPPNEYGNERYIIRAQIPPDYTVNGEFKGLTVMLWDRRRSLQLRTGPGDPVFAEKRGLGYKIPFHQQGHQKFVRLVAQKGLQRQLLFAWARRVGDCLEIDLEDIPPQNQTW